jgi:hypothetical protein
MTVPTKLFFGAVFFAIFAAWFFYDSWLRPANIVGLWCGIILLLTALVAFVRSFWLKIITALMLLFFILASIPMPSFQRFLLIQNDTEETFLIQVSHRTENRKKSKNIRPRESWKFIYFSGDYGLITNIPVEVTVTRVRDQFVTSTLLILPIQTNPPPFILYELYTPTNALVVP